jgi:uncharacterized protein (TIGR02147 family)
MSVFSYTDPAPYLSDAFAQKKKKNPSFSIRSWAKSIGLESHTPLNLAMTGKRSLSRKHIPALIESLGLNKKEALYFENLVNLSGAKTDAEKRHLLQSLNSARPRNTVSTHEMTHYEVIRDPLHSVLIEMTQLRDFEWNATWIAKRLRRSQPKKIIEAAMQRLIECGLVKVSDTKVTRVHDFATTTPDLKNLAAQEYHAAVCDLAKEALKSQEVHNRQFNGVAFGIQKTKLPAAKERIREFVKAFCQEFESESCAAEEVYQLNFLSKNF